MTILIRNLLRFKNRSWIFLRLKKIAFHTLTLTKSFRRNSSRSVHSCFRTRTTCLRLKSLSFRTKFIKVSEEQKNFSRNLHDGVAQDLAAIKIYHKKGDDDKAAFYADRALSEVRYLIDSSRLEFDEDFESLIKKTLVAFEANHEIKTTTIITSDFLGKLKSESQVEILHILQEALSNIARHANATEVKVRITDVVDEMRFSISDNGKGFLEEAVESQKSDGKNAQRKHWGLNNIRERVQKLGGTVEFINDGGTTVAISIKNPVS